MEQTTTQNNYGYTTGSCARIGVRAALKKILLGIHAKTERLCFSDAITFDVAIQNLTGDDQSAGCTIQKYSGSDPDITNGMLIDVFVQVTPGEKTEVIIRGGEGIGRVTKPGLDQPVGEAAINSGPRKMITEEVLDIAKMAGFVGTIDIVISAPEGKELAKKTFNPKLGIVGGISILGTTGLLEPMSDRAVIETTKTHLSQVLALGYKKAVITPGNIGEVFAKEELGYPIEQIVQSSNYIGDALLHATDLGFDEIFLVGHVGKLIKLAGKMMNTHSMYGDCRKEIMAAYAASAGAATKSIRGIMACVSTDEMVRILADESRELLMATFDQIGNEIMENMSYYIEKNMPQQKEKRARLSLLIFSTDKTVLVRKEGA